MPPVAGIRRAVVTLALLCLTACSTHQSSDGGGPGTAPTPIAPQAAVWYTAIGASDAAGVGSSAPCLPFTDCPNGTGYVPVLARALRSDGHDVTLTNMGIPGAVLGPTTQQIGNQVGLGIPANFLDQEGPFVPRTTTLVTIFAGGNDANTIATAIDRGAASTTSPEAYIDQQIQTFAADYGSLIAQVRARAGNPRIVVLNLPNFAGLPFMAGRSDVQKRWIERLSVGFTTRGANVFAAQGIAVVDLMCDARAYDPSIYSSDGFHPNDAGYAYLAAQAHNAAIATGWPAPAGSCGQMRLAP